MKPKKITQLAILCAVSTVIFSACNTDSPRTQAEELAFHSWYIKENQRECSLRFEGDEAFFSAETDNSLHYSLSGKYYADDKTLVISPENDMPVTLSYTLENESLKLTYQQTEIVLQKNDEPLNDSSVVKNQ